MAELQDIRIPPAWTDRPDEWRAHVARCSDCRSVYGLPLTADVRPESHWEVFDRPSRSPQEALSRMTREQRQALRDALDEMEGNE